MNKPFGHPRALAADVRPRLRVRLNRRRLWRWQLWLVDELAKRGHVPEIDFASGEALPAAVGLLLSLERTLFGLSGEHASDPIDARDFVPIAAMADGLGRPGIVLDLADTALDAALKALRPSYDGATDENALIAALLDGRQFQLAIGDAGSRAHVAVPAVEDGQVLTRALDNVFSTLLRLCLKAIDDPDVPEAAVERPHRPIRAMSLRTLRFAAATAAGKAVGRLTKLCIQAPGWHIHWRWATADRVALTHELPRSGFQRLADDGQRYYADPFVIEAAGTHYLFCEEFDYALGKAFISVTTIPRDGRPATPRPVLEAPHHLSYPFVFEHGGAMWMVPESSGARTVDLYRADPFPNRWVHEATLLSGIQASDATLVAHGGEWWMFASTVERQSSSWDALSIFHSAALTGPWLAHARNPVLIDARVARPAGQIYRSGHELWRPVQDCSESYGGALALCSIDRLDHETFAQTTRARVRMPRPMRGPHTLNWAAGLEVIDAFS